MSTTTIHGPGDLIAALPALLGAIPSDEVVVVGIGPRGEVLHAAVVDRVDLCLPELAPATVPHIVDGLIAAGVTHALLVSWTDLEVGTPCPAIDELTPHLHRMDLEVAAWVTDGRRYWSTACDDPRCCPPAGRPVPAVATAATAARASTRVSHRSDRPHVGVEEKRRATRAGQRWARRRERGRDEWCRQSWSHLAATLDGDADGLEWGKALAALQDVRVRDATIVRWLGASDTVVVDVLDGRQSEGVHRLMDGALRPGSARVPDVETIATAHEWCDRAEAYSRRSAAAVIHALRAVLYWWEADLGAAAVHAHRAIELDSGYTLAMLLEEMCTLGLTPGWRRRRDGERSSGVRPRNGGDRERIDPYRRYT